MFEANQNKTRTGNEHYMRGSPPNCSSTKSQGCPWPCHHNAPCSTPRDRRGSGPSGQNWPRRWCVGSNCPRPRGSHQAFPRTMNVNGKKWLIDLTKTGRERMYLTHEAKGHEIPVPLGNTVATGSSNSTGPTNSFQRAWKSRSVQMGRASGPAGTVRWYSNLRSV